MPHELPVVPIVPNANTPSVAASGLPSVVGADPRSVATSDPRSVEASDSPSRWLRLLHFGREIALDLIAIIWPCACVVCGAANRELCAACLAQIRGVGEPHSAGSFGQGPKWVLTPSGVAACVSGPYAGPLRAVLVAYKHGGRTRFATHLGAQLRAPLRAALAHARSPAPLAVTVPSRSSKMRERGYHHVDLLVRCAIGRSWRPTDKRPIFIVGALRATTGRTGQVGLSATARRLNAARVRVPKRMIEVLRGREVVLIDDIITTGATVEAAARALTDAGAFVIGIVGLCATERLDQKSSILV